MPQGEWYICCNFFPRELTLVDLLYDFMYVRPIYCCAVRKVKLLVFLSQLHPMLVYALPFIITVNLPLCGTLCSNFVYEVAHYTIFNNVPVCMSSQGFDQPAYRKSFS